MDRSTRFVSLSGYSGISVGISALIGSFLADKYVFSELGVLDYFPIDLSQQVLHNLLVIATGTLLLAVVSWVFFNKCEAKKHQENLLNTQSKRLILSLFIPLMAGGLVCLFLLTKGFLILMIPLTLVFHGLALINASKYSVTELRNLGYLVVLLGLLALPFSEYGLMLWALGFGFLHILYGIIIQRKKG